MTSRSESMFALDKHIVLRESVEALAEEAERHLVAVLVAAVAALVQLEAHAGDPGPLQLAAERLGAEVQPVLVAGAGVQVDRPQPAQRASVMGDHPHGIPGQPPLPDVGTEAARRHVEGQLDRAVLVGRVAGGHRVGLHEGEVLGPEPAAPQVGPEALVRALVAVPERADGAGEVRQVAVLEQGVAGVAGEGAEQVRPQHRRDHRAVATAGVGHHAAVAGDRQRPEAGGHPGHHVLAQVRVVAAGGRRVEVLAAAERRPAVDEDHDAGRRLAGREQLVHHLGERVRERAPVAPHVHLAGVSLQDVDRGIAPVGPVVVRRRQIDPERPAGGVVQRVVAQVAAVDPDLLQPARPLDVPGSHGYASAATSAWPTSAVEAAPPRSPVSTRPSSQTASIARSTRSAAAAWPRWRSMSADDQTAPIGLARPWPAMSGAEPCTGSNIDGPRPSTLRLPLAASPRLPWRAAPRSVRMSANRLEPTTTSTVSGRSTMRAAMASTWTRSTWTSGCCRARRAITSSQST